MNNHPKTLEFLKNWTLPIAMISGVAAYFLYVNIPALDSTHTFAAHAISIVQPMLIFSMLFLTFCKVKPSDLRLARWQAWLLMLQTGSFILAALLLYILPDSHWKVVIESGMLCMICPTATAAAVVTRKLGGDAGSLTTYTILINLATAICVPALVPIIHPHEGMTFVPSFLSILSRVFPLLFGPFLLAVVLRSLSPKITEWLAQFRDLSFYLWAIALALAIAMTTRSLVRTSCPLIYQAGIAAVSLLTCIVQFAFGRKVGRKYGEPISAAQSCGQKNTVLAIWMGYTFMDPVTSIAGGFYSIWHNVWNSWQLYQQRGMATDAR